MHTNLTPEIYWLTLTILITALFWVPYIINRVLENGVITSLVEPEGITSTTKPWANRMMRAHVNAIENLVLFAPLVLSLQILGISTQLTVNACMVYFFARTIHFIAFSFGWPGYIRILAFLAGVYAQLTLVFILLE